MTKPLIGAGIHKVKFLLRHIARMTFYPTSTSYHTALWHLENPLLFIMVGTSYLASMSLISDICGQSQSNYRAMLYELHVEGWIETVS